MTGEQIAGVVRALAAAIGGYLIGKGWDAALVNEIAGAASVLAVAGWSIWSKRKAA